MMGLMKGMLGVWNIAHILRSSLKENLSPES